MVDLGLCKVSSSLGYFTPGFMLGPKFSQFSSACDCTKAAFSNLATFSKNKIPWNFKIWFSKIIHPMLSSDEISEIRPSGRWNAVLDSYRQPLLTCGDSLFNMYFALNISIANLPLYMYSRFCQWTHCEHTMWKEKWSALNFNVTFFC